jgi:hypothetical protein
MIYTGGRVPSHKASPGHWPRGPSPPAAPCLGGGRLAAWGPQRAGCQIRPEGRRHPSPAADRGGGAPTVALPLAKCGRPQARPSATGPDRRSSLFGTGATASSRVRPGRLWWAGAAAARSAPQPRHPQAAAQFQGTLSCTPTPGAVETSCVTSDLYWCQIGVNPTKKG